MYHESMYYIDTPEVIGVLYMYVCMHVLCMYVSTRREYWEYYLKYACMHACMHSSSSGIY